MPDGKRVMVDWQDGTRAGVIVGSWPDSTLRAKYLGIGVQPDQLEGMVLVEYDDIGRRVTAASAIRKPLASPELEAAHRAGYERGLCVGRSIGDYEARAAMKTANRKSWLRRLFRWED